MSSLVLLMKVMSLQDSKVLLEEVEKCRIAVFELEGEELFLARQQPMSLSHHVSLENITKLLQKLGFRLTNFILFQIFISMRAILPSCLNFEEKYKTKDNPQ